MPDPYFAKPGLSFHQLKDLATKSPRYYLRKHVTKEIHDEDKDSYRIGRLVHLAVLEPDKFAALPAVPAEHLTPSGGLSTKAATRTWLDALTDRDFGTPDELEQCRRIAAAVGSNIEAAEIVAAGKAEVEHAGEREGHQVKARADLISDGAVWDLKTTRSLDGIVREIREFAYAEQIWWYADLFQVRAGGLIVVEKEEPHRCLVVRFDSSALEAAGRRTRAWFVLYQACVATGEWPAHPPSMTLTAAALAAA